MRQVISIIATVILTLSIFCVVHAELVYDSDGSYVTEKEFYAYSSSFRDVLETLEQAGQRYIQEEILPQYEADGRLDSIQIWRTATQSGARNKTEETTNGGN